MDASLRLLWEEVLCPKPKDEEWHAIDCLRGACASCGFQKLRICPDEVSDEKNCKIRWKKFGYETIGINKKDQPIRRLKLQYKETAPFVLVAELKSKIMTFLLHNFTAKWQDSQFKYALFNLPFYIVLSVLDFAENYTF